MMWNSGGDAWGGFWMAVVAILFLGGLLLLGVWAVRASSGSTRSGDAMETLRKRLASGEISPEEFEKTRKALGA